MSAQIIRAPAAPMPEAASAAVAVIRSAIADMLRFQSQGKQSASDRSQSTLRACLAMAFALASGADSRLVLREARGVPGAKSGTIDPMFQCASTGNADAPGLLHGGQRNNWYHAGDLDASIAAGIAHYAKWSTLRALRYPRQSTDPVVHCVDLIDDMLPEDRADLFAELQRRYPSAVTVDVEQLRVAA